MTLTKNELVALHASFLARAPEYARAARIIKILLYDMEISDPVKRTLQ